MPMPWSKPCGGAWRRNVMITFLGQLATLALLSTLASWKLLRPNKGRTGRPIERTVPHLLMDSRPGPKCGAGCRLATLLTLLHCQVSRSVRVPALSVGAGEGNSLAYQRRLQVPKLNGVQVTDGKQEPTLKWNRCVKRSFMRACNRAIRHLSFPSDTRGVFSCRSSLPCLVPNADRMLAAATYPVLGWDGPHRAPAPRMLRDVVWMYVLPGHS